MDWRSVAQVSIPVAVFLSLVISIPATIAASDDPASAPTNIFSNASPAGTTEVPRFVKKGRGSDRLEMNRRMMGERDGIPGWQELKILPSLNAVQRKKIHEIYEESKKDAGPLQEELKEMRAPRPEGIPQRPASSGFPGSRNSDLRPGPKPNFDPDKIARFNELRFELKAKRDQAWEKVKTFLTEENLSDLELMRKGELLPEGLKEDSRGPATSSLGKQLEAGWKPALPDRIAKPVGSQTSQTRTDLGLGEDKMMMLMQE